jgi:3-methyladenine DNA glycosylase AlkC
MENSNAFKNLINSKVVQITGEQILKFYPIFELKKFVLEASELDDLELKARVLQITKCLKKYLPEDYLHAIGIITEVISSDTVTGFALWPFSEFIGQYGLADFDVSMDAMYLLTQKFTSEFAIRTFFINDHSKVLKYFHKWAKDKNPHVRRLVSEGSRPLLPWGMKLEVFVKDPSLTILLLDKLKWDDELYVRKSVANHLNDISKHHPRLVIVTLKRWEGECPLKHADKLAWIKKHALRTLIKKGDVSALKLMGVSSKAKIAISKISLGKKIVKIGEKLEFTFTISSKAKVEQKLVVDYLIHYVKANKTLRPKVYKLKTFTIRPGQKILISKSHSLRQITTIVFYEGEHMVSVQINGKIIVNEKWQLYEK